MSHTAYIGADPGQAGGIAVIYSSSKVVAWPMPSTERDLCDLLREIGSNQDFRFIAAVEQVHSMPRQGVASSFKFGMNYGGLRMAFVALGFPLRAVTPQAWQKEMGCLTKGDKLVSLRRAQELFPHLAWGATKASRLAVADAL